MAEEDKLLKYCVRVTKAQRAKIEAGGLPWFRKLIDRAKLPKTIDGS